MVTRVSDKGLRAPALDYDLHGLAGIRLLDAAPADVTAVTRQLGCIQRPLTRGPDLIIRFVDRLRISSRVRFLGDEQVGFTDDAFLLLSRNKDRGALAQFALGQAGNRCEIVCVTGLPAVPLLLPILNLAVLGNGGLPVHASAFSYEGTGVLAAGWSHGCKTGTLLAFMAKGARYIGDDWVYISDDGRRMYGLPDVMQIRDSYLQDLPQYQALAGRAERVRRRALKLAHAMARGISRGLGARSLPARGVRALTRMLEERLTVRMEPSRLFGEGSCMQAGTLDKILLLLSHDGPGVTVRPMEPEELARRLAFALAHERLGLLSYYLKFRFAFPEAASTLIEEAGERERELLNRVTAGKETYAVYHPYPVAIPALFDALSPLVDRANACPVERHAAVLPSGVEEDEG
jgi:hypothetical protein